MLDEVEQQRFGPLDVVDHDDQRLFGRGRLDQAAYTPERLLHRAGGPDADQPRQRVDYPVAIAVARREQRADRRARRVGVEIVGQPGGVAHELRDRLEGGLAGAIAPQLDGLRTGVLGQARAQLAREPRLADAGGAEHGHEARPRRGARVVERADEPLHLRVAADEW